LLFLPALAGRQQEWLLVFSCSIKPAMLRYSFRKYNVCKQIPIRIGVFFLSLLAAPGVYAQVNAQVLEICEGDTVLLSIDSANEAASRYEWYLNGDLIVSTGQASMEVTDTGEYNIIAFNEGGCGSPLSNSIRVRWKHLYAFDDETATLPETATSISILINDEGGCAGIDSSSLIIIHPPWFGNVHIAGGQIVYKPFRGFAGTDSFDYKIRDRNGNLSNLARVLVHVGSDPDVAINDVIIYPNPVSDYLYIKGDPDKIEKIMLITDRGRQLYEMKPFSAVSVINVREYAQAIYWVRVIFKSGPPKSYKVLRID
jgi:hypothetical protein